MQRYLAALTIVLLLAMVMIRIILMGRAGTRAMHLGSIDKTDFLIPPFALFYFYTVFAAAFDLPMASDSEFFHSEIAAWLGVACCLSGLILLLLSLISFGKSFRVGIDVHHSGSLITTGIFSFSRNPIYVAFGCILLGEFLVFPDWIRLVYLGAGMGLFHRQVLREEAFMRRQYGADYAAYCKRVRRYI